MSLWEPQKQFTVTTSCLREPLFTASASSFHWTSKSERRVQYKEEEEERAADEHFWIFFFQPRREQPGQWAPGDVGLQLQCTWLLRLSQSTNIKRENWSRVNSNNQEAAESHSAKQTEPSICCCSWAGDNCTGTLGADWKCSTWDTLGREGDCVESPGLLRGVFKNGDDCGGAAAERPGGDTGVQWTQRRGAQLVLLSSSTGTLKIDTVRMLSAVLYIYI